MDKKKNILEAWIMVEHLSEGDINSEDKHLKKISSYIDDYYTLFKNEILGKTSSSDKNGGIVLYFNIFQFKNVISLLREQFKLDESDEDIKLGDKFSFAVYFDKELKLSDNVAFFTESYYILKNKKVPKEKEFLEYEEENKTYIRELFECSEDENYKEFFNKAFAKLIKKYSLDLEKCRMKVSDNLKSDNTNLHSFFIKDLEKAKNADSETLNKYLLGAENEKIKNRIVLDSKKDKENYNPDAFYEILQPKNYPLARFPSNLDYALSLMQQVALNLVTGYDDEQMRSVNGPPGTGKTTLLKDVFAQLIVDQAYEITNLKYKRITDNIHYCDKSKVGIGKVPKSIADKGIVVASSNNTAVQNIVNELPLCKEIDDTFSKEIREADYFWKISNSESHTKSKKTKENERVIEDKFWGLFSKEGGKKQNMDGIIKSLEDVVKHLKKDYESNPKVYDKFREQYKSLVKYRQEKQDICTKYLSLIQQGINEHPYEFQKKSIMGFLKDIWNKLKRKHQINSVTQNDNNKSNIANKGIEVVSTEKDVLIKKMNDMSVKALDMNENYQELQKSNPWFDRKFRKKQARLFITALKVRKQFLYENLESIEEAIEIWNQQYKYRKNKDLIKESWHWINMVIPVISSTFASINYMFKNLGENTIGYLFIDEAGQALPQASVGAISRSKQVMVLGDPAQIKPVLTLDFSILGILGKHYDVSDKYLSDKASTQTLVDNISKYGFYDDKGEWIGIPLWVHRRCRNQMYEISNIISYEGNMVQGRDVDGKVDWYDISGKASDKYVKEQGEFLRNKIQELINQNPKLVEGDDKIFVISPFRHVANELQKELADLLNTISSKNSNNKPISIGTVHTFQGKEAPIVFLVLGCDESNKGAANWAMGSENPNIMNVAATRAKEEFYIIGDKKLFKELGSDVIKKTLEVIEKSNNENVEKQCD